MRACVALCAVLSLSGLTEARSDEQSLSSVSVELVLAVDTSVSVDASEYALQMTGISSALRSPEIVDLISRHPGGVAATLVHWSLGSVNSQAVPWHRLHDATSIEAFAGLVAMAERSSAAKGTSIGDAIAYATDLLETNRYIGAERKIDLSADSRSNSGADPRAARDRAISQGITVNGLAIVDGDQGLPAYFRLNVIGGPESFVLAANGHEDFAAAMRRKLARELKLLVSERARLTE